MCKGDRSRNATNPLLIPTVPRCHTTTGHVSDDVADSEGGVPNLNLKRISQSPDLYSDTKPGDICVRSPTFLSSSLVVFPDHEIARCVGHERCDGERDDGRNRLQQDQIRPQLRRTYTVTTASSSLESPSLAISEIVGRFPPPTCYPGFLMNEAKQSLSVFLQRLNKLKG